MVPSSGLPRPARAVYGCHRTEPVCRSTFSCSLTGRMVGRQRSTGSARTTTDRCSAGSTALASSVS